jgi:hypothetical protein
MRPEGRQHLMTLRLDGLVVRGEIDNTRPYSVCGWLKLRGHRTPLTLNLTGDCGPTLKGLRVRFEHPVPPDDRDDEAPDLSELAWQQIGPTGAMGLVPTEAGQPGRLSLEWFSQNGRVTLELTDPVLEAVADDSDDEDDPADEAEADVAALAGGDEADDDEDPYGLFPEELKERFDTDAEELDREVLPEADGYEPVRAGISEVEEMEDLIENGEGIPIGNVFDPPIKLPRPEGLPEAEVEPALKTLLAKLAEHGISLDVCEHFTPADAYQLLLDEICPFELTHPDLEATRWVQHFSTSDFCETCEAEFEREVEEYERNRGGTDEDDED